MSEYDRRRCRRFLMRQPAVISFGDEWSEVTLATTENLCNAGALLQAAKLIPAGSKVGIRVLLSTGVELKGSGVVIRTTQEVAHGPVFIAVDCDVPFDMALTSS
jgi:hypothetical protein